MKRILLTLLILYIAGFAWAEPSVAIRQGEEKTDSVVTQDENPSLLDRKEKTSFLERIVRPIEKLLDVDTNYVEPQHHNFQAMMQNRYSYEVYQLTDEAGNTMRFEPKPSMKIGPYAGWSLLFWGYSIDVLHLTGDNRRQEFDVSLYTLPLGIDLFYRKSGDDYSLRDIKLTGIDTSSMEGVPFSGFESSVIGANFYYIFNHRRFSYPAAFNQSTVQKRSCGSALTGIGYTKHSLRIDIPTLNDLFLDNLGVDISNSFTKNLEAENITYTNLELSGGYAYNWVFAPRWCFAASLSLALSYKRAVASNDYTGLDRFVHTITLQGFNLKDITIDGTGRFGIVWNTGKWFAGASAIVHTYNYNKSQFYTNNTFGSVNIYAGFNFGLKKKYRR